MPKERPRSSSTSDVELMTMAEAAKAGSGATLQRISERLQGDVDAMRFLDSHGLRPGAVLQLAVAGGRVLARRAMPPGANGGGLVPVPDEVAELVYVTSEPDEVGRPEASRRRSTS